MAAPLKHEAVWPLIRELAVEGLSTAAQIQSLLSDGLTQAEVADRINISRSAVSQQIIRHNLAVSVWGLCAGKARKEANLLRMKRTAEPRRPSGRHCFVCSEKDGLPARKPYGLRLVCATCLPAYQAACAQRGPVAWGGLAAARAHRKVAACR